MEVPVRVDGVPGTDVGVRPVVDVRVGNGPLVPVLLDTGGSGLEIYPSGLDLRPGSGIAMTSRRFGLVYEDGSVQRGSVASGRVTVGGVTTAHDIQFGVIRSVGCTTSEPHCPLDGVSPAHGVYGVLGTSLGESLLGLQNPLMELPAPYSRSWSIRLAGLGGVLTLGAPLPADPAAELQLPVEKSAPGRAPAFDDGAAPVCWHFGVTGLCLPTLFDTGSNLMEWYSPAWALQHRIGSRFMSTGTAVSASEKVFGRPFWTFFTGTGASQDLVTRLRSAVEKVNTGVQAFYALKVTYDAVHGRLFLTVVGSTAGRVRVSNIFQEANTICVGFDQEARRASATAPPENAQDLVSVQRTAAWVTRQFAILSLRGDSRLARLRLPAADMPLFNRALALREAEAHKMLNFAHTLMRYHTWNAYMQAGQQFASQFRAAERGWSSDMNSLGIGGCTTI